MRRMRGNHLLMLCSFLACTLFAGQLEDQLYDEMKQNGKSSFSNLEIALIAGGVEDPEDLQSNVSAYGDLLKEMALSEKEIKKSDKKKLKILLKKLWNRLKDYDESSYSLTDLWKHGRYSRLTATYLLLDMAHQAEITDMDWKANQDNLDMYFLTGNPKEPFEILGALYLKKAIELPTTSEKDILTALNLSTLIAPNSLYGSQTIDGLLYNRGYELHQEKNLAFGIPFAAAAAKRFPQMKEFLPLCVNFASMLLKKMEANGEDLQSIAMIEMLLPHTGKYRTEFERSLTILNYNYAVSLFNKKEYREAIEIGEKIENPTNASAYKRLMVQSYEGYLDEGRTTLSQDEIDHALAKLKQLDEERAQAFKTRLNQLHLIDLVQAGDFTTAKKMAFEDINTPMGVNNYIAVLSSYVQTLWEKNQFSAALKMMGQEPGQVRATEGFYNLYQSTYQAWLNSIPETDFKTSISILRKVLKDPAIKLNKEHRDGFNDSLGVNLYREIEWLIAERHFHKADAKSKQALNEFPNNQRLKQQRKLVDTILERIKK